MSQKHIPEQIKMNGMSGIAQKDLEHLLKQWHQMHAKELGAVEILIIPEKRNCLQLKIEEVQIMTYEEMMERLRSEGKI